MSVQVSLHLTSTVLAGRHASRLVSTFRTWMSRSNNASEWLHRSPAYSNQPSRSEELPKIVTSSIELLYKLLWGLRDRGGVGVICHNAALLSCVCLSNPVHLPRSTVTILSKLFGWPDYRYSCRAQFGKAGDPEVPKMQSWSASTSPIECSRQSL